MIRIPIFRLLGVLFNKAKTKLIKCPEGKEADSYIIPTTVTSIEKRAFEECRRMTGSLCIPNSVTSIATNAFYWCIFSSLSIPNSVTSIGENAFNGFGMQKIIVAQSVPLGIPQTTFEYVNKKTCELVVPVGSKAAYQAANYWKEFTNITELNNALLVHYNSLGGSAINDTVVSLNTTITTPKDPNKTDLKFAGWFKEADCINQWNFTTDMVATNTTLYAKWISIPTSINTPGTTSVNMFPNPASDFIKIEGEKLQSVTIYNLLGATQLQLNLQGKESVNIIVGNLIPNYYVVEVKTSNGEVNVMKLLKK